MKMIVMIASLMALSLPAFSHAHPNHAGEIGHDHGGLVTGALFFAMSVLVLTVAAAVLRRRRKNASSCCGRTRA